MKHLSVIALAALAIGCARSDHENHRPDPHAIQFQQLEARLSGIEKAADARLADIQRQVAESMAANRQDTGELEIRLSSTIARMEQIASALQVLNSEMQALRAASPSKEATPPSQPPAEPAITTVATPAMNVEEYPVRVYDIAGLTVVTGTKPSSREVDTEESYRDEFGQRAMRRVTEDIEINEYGYRVRFSLENLTDQPVEVRAAAGHASQAISLQPREVIKEVLLDWTPGSALTITAGGQRIRHPIPWE